MYGEEINKNSAYVLKMAGYVMAELQNVDIRYIQEMLGHSSINITEIYTHVAMAKQRDILSNKHPRKDFCF